MFRNVDDIRQYKFRQHNDDFRQLHEYCKVTFLDSLVCFCVLCITCICVCQCQNLDDRRNDLPTRQQDVIRASDFNFMLVLGKGSFGKVKNPEANDGRLQHHPDRYHYYLSVISIIIIVSHHSQHPLHHVVLYFYFLLLQLICCMIAQCY